VDTTHELVCGLALVLLYMASKESNDRLALPITQSCWIMKRRENCWIRSGGTAGSEVGRSRLFHRLAILKSEEEQSSIGCSPYHL